MVFPFDLRVSLLSFFSLSSSSISDVFFAFFSIVSSLSLESVFLETFSFSTLTSKSLLPFCGSLFLF